MCRSLLKACAKIGHSCCVFRPIVSFISDVCVGVTTSVQGWVERIVMHDEADSRREQVEAFIGEVGAGDNVQGCDHFEEEEGLDHRAIEDLRFLVCLNQPHFIGASTARGLQRVVAAAVIGASFLCAGEGLVVISLVGCSIKNS